MTPSRMAVLTDHRLLICAAAWITYVLTFGSLHQLFTTHAAIFAFIPIVLTAWYWGSVAGATAGIAAFGLSVALAGLSTGTSRAVVSAPSLLGGAAFLLSGYAVGLLRDLNNQRAAEVADRIRVETALRERESRLSLVNEITRKIRNDESVESIITAVVSGVGQYFPDFDTSYATLDAQGFEAIVTRSRTGELHATPQPLRRSLSQEYLDRIRSSDLLSLEDASEQVSDGALDDVLTTTNVRAYLSAPIPHGSHMVGLLAIHGPSPHRWSEHERATVRDAADVLAIALEDATRKERLRESEEMFRLLAEYSQAGIALTQKGKLIYANPTLQRIVGYPEAELREMELITITAPEQRELAREWAARRLAGESVDAPVELKIITKDGHERWLGFLGCTIELGGVQTLLTTAIDTTQRRQTEQLLRDSEQRLRNVLDHLGDGVTVTVDGRIVYVNPPLCRMCGYDADELLQADPTIFIDPAPDHARGTEATHASRDSEPAVPRAHEIRGRDGSTTPVEVVTQTIQYGESPALLTTIRDLTERKRQEAALREQEERMQILLDHHPDGILQIVDGKIAYANRAACQMSGYAAEELVGQDPLLTVAPRDYDRARTRAASPTAAPLPTEYQTLRRDGTSVPVEVVASPPIPHGGSTAVFVTIRDIGERVEQQRTLRISEERFRTLFEQAPIGIVLAEPDTTFVRVNAAFCEMLGYTENELVGRSFVDITHRDDLGGSPESARRVLEDARSVVRFQKRYMRKDESVVQAETTVSLVRDAAGQLLYALAMIEDVTERRRLEQQLEQVQRLESVGQLAGGVAHNFNNALTAIYGYSELLGRRFDPDDPALKDLEQIKRVAEHSAGLTRQLLAFSRKEQVRPSVFQLSGLVAEIEDLLGPILGDDIELVTRLGDLQAAVRADRGQMEQVITNLVLNARDAMPDGGTLTVATQLTDVADDAVLQHPGARPGRYVSLVVTDTGSGMDEETIERVFEPFFTTKEQGKGVGLGLAMVHGAVSQSGGFVTVASAIGVGSSFTVYLPAHDEATARSKATRADTSANL